MSIYINYVADMAFAVFLGSLLVVTGSEAVGDPDVTRTWSRLDQPVAAGEVSRTWFWGPSAISNIHEEPYVDAPDGKRLVIYFDKTRMEINANATSGSTWRVTNGLLATELLSGRVQIGDATFVDFTPPEINVAGDLDDPNGPTYWSLSALRDAPALPEGTLITQTIDRSGRVGTDETYESYGVTAAHYVPQTGHMVASVFWDYVNSSGTVYVNGGYAHDRLFENAFYGTGYPITGAYWTRVRVGGVEQSVLVQAFERRVLTYTPGNRDGWTVEAGNVGLHYKEWRESLGELSYDMDNGSSENADECEEGSDNVSENGTVKQSNSVVVNQSGGGNSTVTCTQTNKSVQKR